MVSFQYSKWNCSANASSNDYNHLQTRTTVSSRVRSLGRCWNVIPNEAHSGFIGILMHVCADGKRTIESPSEHDSLGNHAQYLYVTAARKHATSSLPGSQDTRKTLNVRYLGDRFVLVWTTLSVQTRGAVQDLSSPSPG